MTQQLKRQLDDTATELFNAILPRLRGIEARGEVIRSDSMHGDRRYFYVNGVLDHSVPGSFKAYLNQVEAGMNPPPYEPPTQRGY